MVPPLGKMHHPPVVREGILQLGLGQSIILPAKSIMIVRLPMKLDQTVEYKDLGTLPKGIVFYGWLRRAWQYLTFQFCNKNDCPANLGSKHQFCGVLLPQGVQVNVKDTFDKVKPCKHVQMRVSQPIDLASKMQAEFPTVLGKELGCVRHYQAEKMKFKGEVPIDGGKQADFSRPIVAKQIADWLEAKVIERVDYRTRCISPLLLIPNVKKVGLEPVTICAC